MVLQIHFKNSIKSGFSSINSMLEWSRCQLWWSKHNEWHCNTWSSKFRWPENCKPWTYIHRSLLMDRKCCEIFQTFLVFIQAYRGNQGTRSCLTASSSLPIFFWISRLTEGISEFIPKIRVTLKIWAALRAFDWIQDAYFSKLFKIPE